MDASLNLIPPSTIYFSGTPVDVSNFITKSLADGYYVLDTVQNGSNTIVYMARPAIKSAGTLNDTVTSSSVGSIIVKEWNGQNKYGYIDNPKR